MWAEQAFPSLILPSLPASPARPCRSTLQNNDLQMIVRAHECVMDGFERFAQGHLITLFRYSPRAAGCRVSSSACTRSC